MAHPILFLSYLFPPRGGAGVQRALKLVKYLPQYGYQPLVIANGGSAKDYVTTHTDPTLLKDLPAGSVVEYTHLTPVEERHFQRMQGKWAQRLAITDPMTWWNTPAVRTGLELAAKHAPKAVFATLSPFSAAIAAMKLADELKLPLALDLRDPWALDETRIYPSRWHAWKDWRAMRKVLERADLLILNTPLFQKEAIRAMGPQIENKSVVVTNGFDPEDFQSHAAHPAVAPPPPGVLRIVHTGMFHSELAQVWDDLHARRGWMNKLKHAGRPINLWTRTPRYLLAAMHEAIQSGAMRSDQIELVLVGEITGGDRKLVESSPVASSVKMLGYRTHEESVAWLRGADVLFLPNHTPLDGGPALIVPGKTYEYLAARRPILAMGPPGDWRDFVRDCESGDCIDGEDVKAATAALVDFYRRQVAGGLADVGRPDKIAEFSREHVARKVAAALDRLLK